MENAVLHAEMRTDPRFPAGAVPSITGLRLSNGDVVTLVNISRSGILMEGRTRFVPGSRVTIMFEGTFRSSAVKGRIVRCAVCSIDGGSLRYQSGIEFDKRLEPILVERPPAEPTPTRDATAVALQQAALPDVTSREAQNRWY